MGSASGLYGNALIGGTEWLGETRQRGFDEPRFEGDPCSLAIGIEFPRHSQRLTVKPQLAWSEARSLAVDDGMSFSPWHGLAAHLPLGGIMRVRKAIYEEARKFRAKGNGRVVQEPREMVRFRD
jgi:hypothetical protein